MRRKRRNNQRKIILITSISLLFILTVGYAAFQTNLNISAKGNVVKKEMTTAELRSKYCNTTSGDGLYKDIYEEGRCVYKGANPDNYIAFNDELWRILSVESDETLKIIKKESIRNMEWDNANPNSWTRPATINTYLNSTYYNDLSDFSKSFVVMHDFNIGYIELRNKDFQKQLQDEESLKWSGKVGLITVGDYIMANTNTAQCGTFGDTNINYNVCKETNFITSFATKFWSMTKGHEYTTLVYVIDTAAGIANDGLNVSYDVHPVIYLKSGITLKGKGTKDNPYVIN